MTVVAEKVAAPPPLPKRILPSKIRLLEFGRASWHVIVPASDTMAEALAPEYLGGRAYDSLEGIKVGAEIELVDEKYRWLTKSLVVGVDLVAHAIYHVLLPGYPMDLTRAKEKLPKPDLGAARVEEGGAEQRWRVMHGHTVLKAGCATRAEAELWLENKKAGRFED